MLAYTITNGGTYSTDAYEYKYTTSITETFTQDVGTGPCGNNFPKTISITNYTASTEQLFHDGRLLESIFISYKDNQPTSYKVKAITDTALNTACIGGYYSTNSFTLQKYTINEPNGKRTQYDETVAGVNDPPRGGSRTILGSTIIKWTKPWDGTTAVPVITTRTVNKNVYNTSTTKESFKSSFIKAGDSLSLVNFTKTQKTNTEAINSKTTEWVISNKEEKTRLGYSYEKEGSSASNPSINFNYADTVVFITNNNILWYITDYGKGEFTKKFKSTRGIGQQVTIKYNKSTKKEELPIGYLSYNQSPPSPGVTELVTETTSIRINTFTTTKIKVNTSYGVFPLPTILADEIISSTKSSKFTTQQYTSYKDKDTPTKYTTTYKTLLQVIKGNTLEFDRTYKDINEKISTFNSFVTYSFGEHTASDANGGTTFKDEIGYTSLVKECYSINTEGGGEFIFNKGYLNGQAAINNLSIVEQVSFKEEKTFENIGGFYTGSNDYGLLYRQVDIVFASFAKSFTFIDKGSTKTAYSPIEDTNLKLDLRYVLISSSKETTSSNKEKYTKIDTTKHEFELKGKTPKTYLNYRFNNLNNGLLVNPNQYCNLNNSIFNNMNCGIFCDDGQIKSFITRIIYPGTYLAINTEGIKSSVIGKVVTLRQGVKSYYYLPWNGSIQSNGTLNLLSPSVTSASHDISHFLPELGSMTKI